jgi:hypothetical protein
MTWDRRLYFPSEGRRAEDIFTRKIRRLRPGLNPRTWVPKASTLPLDHRSRFAKYQVYSSKFLTHTRWQFMLNKNKIHLKRGNSQNIMILQHKTDSSSERCKTVRNTFGMYTSLSYTFILTTAATAVISFILSPTHQSEHKK